MATRVQNYRKNFFDQNPIHSMSHFAVNNPSWWNSHEQLVPQSLSKHFSLKVESPSQLCREAKHLDLQRQDQDSSSTQSSDQSRHDVSNIVGTNSQDQCISSEHVRDESYGKHVEGQMKPVCFMGHPGLNTNPSQIDPSQSMNHILYPYADPYRCGLFAAYGPPAIIQQQMVGMTPMRVPLPLDHLAEDGPIYVNAKQYHAILRRRERRAKLEAQNKLVKSRKPYLHESRHLHALNRVRGSGGRFLRTKTDQQSDPTPATDSLSIPKSIPSSQKGDVPEFEPCQPETTGKYGASIPSRSGITSVSNSEVIFWQADRGFSTTSHGPRHRAPVVR